MPRPRIRATGQLSGFKARSRNESHDGHLMMRLFQVLNFIAYRRNRSVSCPVPCTCSASGFRRWPPRLVGIFKRFASTTSVKALKHLEDGMFLARGSGFSCSSFSSTLMAYNACNLSFPTLAPHAAR